MQKNNGNTLVEELIANIREFLRERGWEKHNNPKDLAESICIEAAELLQLFQWASPEEVAKFKRNPTKMTRIMEELADVIIYCFRTANAMSIDVPRSVIEKLESNKKKYPAKQNESN